MGFLKKGRKKKGQVTLFIIIGILLLAIVIFALILINRSKDIDGFQPDEVPPELVPIGNYVEDCLYETSEQAFRVLGDNGGYINPQNYFEKGFVPTESDILEFSPGSSIWMPYWWYLESENDCNSDCMFGSHMPPLEGSGNFGPNSLLSEVNVEGMIEIYIEQNLGNCLNEFGLLTNEFEIVAEKDPEIRTSILANNIVIDLTYPLEINSGVGEGKLERFRIYLPLNFRRIYNMAKDITTAQQQLNF